MMGGINLGIKGTKKNRHFAWNKGLTKETDERMKRISQKLSKHNKENDPRIAKQTYEDKMGQNNPMSRTKFKGNRAELARKLSISMKNLIKNGEYTPKTTNRLSHNKLEYDGIKFRSSWEVVFHYFNKNMLYEKIRIPYTLENVEHIYISDFYDEQSKTIYEIKPDNIYKFYNKKMKAIETSISQNTSYNYVHLGDDWAKSVIIPEDCDINDEILQLFKRGLNNEN